MPHAHTATATLTATSTTTMERGRHYQRSSTELEGPPRHGASAGLSPVVILAVGVLLTANAIWGVV